MWDDKVVSNAEFGCDRPRFFLRKNELDSASRTLATESQRVHFARLLQELAEGGRISSKPVARLAPFIDTEGVIRVGGTSTTLTVKI